MKFLNKIIIIFLLFSIPSMLLSRYYEPQIDKWLSSEQIAIEYPPNDQDNIKPIYKNKKIFTETRSYYLGARYYDPKLSRWTAADPPIARGDYLPKPGDFDTDHNYFYYSAHDSTAKLKGHGGVFNPINLDAYHYAGQNPVKFVDPTGNDAVAVVFPDYKIAAVGTTWSGLGHAGVLLIDNKTGQTNYYEYGRYDDAGKGLVRTFAVPNVVMDKKTGLPTQESLQKTLDVISKKAGHGGKISGAYVKNDNYKAMKDYATGRMSDNKNPNRKGYSIGNNNCGTFMKDTIQAGGVDTPFMIDPRPNSYIGEMRNNFIPLDYSNMGLKLKKDK